MDLQVLVHRTCDGDDDAANALFEALARGLRQLIRRRTMNDCDDVLNLVWHDLLTWLRRSRVRELSVVLRHARKITDHHCAADLNNVPRRPPQAARNGYSAAAMLRALQSLPADQRRVLISYYFHERSSPEIQLQMGLTPRQYDALMFSGLQALRRQFATMFATMKSSA